MTRTVVLLGPQRYGPRVPEVLAGLDHDGEVATVTAGWEEREEEDDDLRAAVGGRPVNVGLHRRWRDVLARDPDFARAERERLDREEELQRVYLLRLHHAVEAVRDLWRHVGDDDLRDAAVDDAIALVRDLDSHHLDRLAEVRDAFHADWPPHERPVVAEHRAAVAELVDRAGAVAIAGGHVGVLAHCLHLFNLAAALGDRPVVAWSAGAMVASERIVLFHDFAPHGPGHAEVLGVGLGLVRDVVPLPHADRRLDLADRRRTQLLARRFAPARLVPMDRTARVDCVDGACGPAPLVDREGSVSFEPVP